jgi:hypothetical protein
MRIRFCGRPIDVVHSDTLYKVSVRSNLLFCSIQYELVWDTYLLSEVYETTTGLSLGPHRLEIGKTTVSEHLTTG